MFSICFVFLTTSTLLSGAVETDKKKKYVIEIQDHQQAMKFANPIVDLEETVRRGINDPLADPQFVMNRINKDYFHIPLTTSSRENKELLSYHSFDDSSPGFPSISNRKLTPPVQEHAVKEEFVANAPSIFRPIFQQNQQRNGNAKTFQLHKHMNRYVSGNRRGNILQKLKLQRLENENTPSVTGTTGGENINPLTGLPEDLEANSYRAVASITAVSDHQRRPSTVTVDLSDPVKLNNDPSRSRDTTNEQVPENSKLTNDQNFLDNNLDLKSFVEADTILREKLNKEGLSIHALQKRNKVKRHPVART